MHRLRREKIIRLALMMAASASVLIVLLIFLFVGKEAVPFLANPGISELFGSRWMPVSFQRESFGLLPLITGSLLVTGLAAVIAAPLGLCIAVYIAEAARPAEREFLKPFIELLAGIPSVVIGFFGLVTVAPAVKSLLGLSTGQNALTGAILLALMALPTIVTLAEDALRAVPESYKQASLALGASDMQTVWRVVVPAATPGILAAQMLGMGRVIGETMAVMMVTGNAAVVSFSPTSSVRTMTATIAAEMGEVSFGGNHYRALFCVGIVLLLATFALNMAAQRSLPTRRRS